MIKQHHYPRCFIHSEANFLSFRIFTGLITKMSSKAVSRLSAHFARTARTGFSRKSLGCRFQTTDATAAPSQSTFQRLWNSPVGVKTVHFWYSSVGSDGWAG